jgi:hypothetical protein
MEDTNYNNDIFYQAIGSDVPNSEYSENLNSVYPQDQNTVDVDSILFTDSKYSDSHKINTRLMDVHRVIMESNFLPTLSEEYPVKPYMKGGKRSDRNKSEISESTRSTGGESQNESTPIPTSSPEEIVHGSSDGPSLYAPRVFSATRSSVDIPRNMNSSVNDSSLFDNTMYTDTDTDTDNSYHSHNSPSHSSYKRSSVSRLDKTSIDSTSPSRREPISSESSYSATNSTNMSNRSTRSRSDMSKSDRGESLIEKHLNKQFRK